MTKPEAIRYNEDDNLFCKSLTAIMKNIAHLCSRKRSSMWGDEGWKKVVVCIVSDVSFNSLPLVAVPMEA